MVVQRILSENVVKRAVLRVFPEVFEKGFLLAWFCFRFENNRGVLENFFLLGVSIFIE
jgi:hypothetical protein